MLRWLLPLIAALKVRAEPGQGSWDLGRSVAQAYKGCKVELGRRPGAAARPGPLAGLPQADAEG